MSKLLGTVRTELAMLWKRHRWLDTPTSTTGNPPNAAKPVACRLEGN